MTHEREESLQELIDKQIEEGLAAGQLDLNMNPNNARPFEAVTDELGHMLDGRIAQCKFQMAPWQRKIAALEGAHQSLEKMRCARSSYEVAEALVAILHTLGVGKTVSINDNIGLEDDVPF